MPGIAGIIAKDAQADFATIAGGMVQSMTHESFYASGVHHEPRLGVWAGWTSLKGSFSDANPIWNEARDVCLIFTGEEFSDRTDIQALRAKGHDFRKGDANYLVHLYEEMGLEFLCRLNGLFSGLLIDLRQSKAVLFNDRYGMNRVYVHENKDGLYFASEAKAVLKCLPELRRLDVQSAGEYLSIGCVLQNRTIFPGISLLPPGSAWEAKPNSSLRKSSYFDPQTLESQKTLTPLQYEEAAQAVWRRILPRYLNGQLPVGLSLTGGLDSRMILAWAPQKLPCYTFGGMYRDCHDVTVAREIAKIRGHAHETISLDKDFFEKFPDLVRKSVYITDGALDPTGTVDLYMQRRAREIAPVRLTGLYGGEILRRIVLLKPTNLGTEVAGAELARGIREAHETFAREFQGHKLSFIVFKQAPWFIHARLSLERSQVSMRTPYFDNELVALAYQAPPEMATSSELGLRLIARGAPSLDSVATDRGQGLKTIPGLHALSRAAGEFSFKAEYAYDSGMPQWLARVDKTLRPLRLEKLFLGRHKISHFRMWYRDELSDYVKAILLDSTTLGRPHLRADIVKRMVGHHVQGLGNYTPEIQRLLTLEMAHRQFLE